MWGILFVIAAATEGFPFTSIHIRDEFWQDVIGGLGLFLALLGLRSRKNKNLEAKQTTRPPDGSRHHARAGRATADRVVPQ
jgi:hypothetical protein